MQLFHNIHGVSTSQYLKLQASNEREPVMFFFLGYLTHYDLVLFHCGTINVLFFVSVKEVHDDIIITITILLEKLNIGRNLSVSFVKVGEN